MFSLQNKLVSFTSFKYHLLFHKNYGFFFINKTVFMNLIKVEDELNKDGGNLEMRIFP